MNAHMIAGAVVMVTLFGVALVIGTTLRTYDAVRHQ